MSPQECLAAVNHNLSIFGPFMGGLGLLMGWALTHAWWVLMGWALTHAWWVLWKVRGQSRFWHQHKPCPLCKTWLKDVEFVDG